MPRGTNGLVLLGRSHTFIISSSQEGPAVTSLAKMPQIQKSVSFGEGLLTRLPSGFCLDGDEIGNISEPISSPSKRTR